MKLMMPQPWPMYFRLAPSLISVSAKTIMQLGCAFVFPLAIPFLYLEKMTKKNISTRGGLGVHSNGTMVGTGWVKRASWAHPVCFGAKETVLTTGCQLRFRNALSLDTTILRKKRKKKFCGQTSPFTACTPFWWHNWISPHQNHRIAADAADRLGENHELENIVTLSQLLSHFSWEVSLSLCFSRGESPCLSQWMPFGF